MKFNLIWEINGHDQVRLVGVYKDPTLALGESINLEVQSVDGSVYDLEEVELLCDFEDFLK